MTARTYRLADAASKIGDGRIYVAVRTARLELEDVGILLGASMQLLIYFEIVRLLLYSSQVLL